MRRTHNTRIHFYFPFLSGEEKKRSGENAATPPIHINYSAYKERRFSLSDFSCFYTNRERGKNAGGNLSGVETVCLESWKTVGFNSVWTVIKADEIFQRMFLIAKRKHSSSWRICFYSMLLENQPWLYLKSSLAQINLVSSVEKKQPQRDTPMSFCTKWQMKF